MSPEDFYPKNRAEIDPPLVALISAVKTGDYESVRLILDKPNLESELLVQAVIVDLLQTRPPEKLQEFFEHVSDEMERIKILEQPFLEQISSNLVDISLRDFRRAYLFMKILFGESCDSLTSFILTEVLNKKMQEIMDTDDIKERQILAHRFTHINMKQMPQDKNFWPLVRDTLHRSVLGTDTYWKLASDYFGYDGELLKKSEQERNRWY